MKLFWCTFDHPENGPITDVMSIMAKDEDDLKRMFNDPSEYTLRSYRELYSV